MPIFGVPFEGVYDFLNAFPWNLFKDIARTLKGWKFSPCSRSSIFSLRRDNGQEGQAAALTRETCGETIIKIMTRRLFFISLPSFSCPCSWYAGVRGGEEALETEKRISCGKASRQWPRRWHFYLLLLLFSLPLVCKGSEVARWMRWLILRGCDHFRIVAYIRALITLIGTEHFDPAFVWGASFPKTFT